MDAQIRFLLQKTSRPLQIRDRTIKNILQVLAMWNENSILDLLFNYLLEENQQKIWTIQDSKGRTSIHMAAAYGNTSFIIKAYEMNPNLILQRDLNENTVLHYAIYFKQENIYSLIMDWFPNDWMNWKNKENYSIFHFCCFVPCMDLILKWSREDPDFLILSVNELDRFGNCGFLLSCQSTQSFMIDILSNHFEIDHFYNAKNYNDETGLHRAVCYPNNQDIIKYLLDLVPYDSDAEDDFESSSEEEDEENELTNCKMDFKIKSKISKFPGKNSKCKQGFSPLHFACMQNSLKYIFLLSFKFDCNINIQDHDGNTPIQYCIYYGYFECVRQLINRNDCDLLLCNNKGRSPLDTACFHGNIDIFQLLLNKLSKDQIKNTKDKKGRTPLHTAVMKGHLKIVKSLLDYFSVDTKDFYGRNSLHLSIIYCKPEILKTIINYSNSINELDDNGNNLLLFAAKIRQKHNNLKLYWEAEKIIISQKGTLVSIKNNVNISYIDFLKKDVEFSPSFTSKVKVRKSASKIPLVKYASINYIPDFKRKMAYVLKEIRVLPSQKIARTKNWRKSTTLSTFGPSPVPRLFFGPDHISESSLDKRSLTYMDSPIVHRRKHN